MHDRFDAVVVGAGPAGLSAAAEATARGIHCLLLDEGFLHERRDRMDPEQVLSGAGGAGLFSDGKHSFFPAATALWRLPDQATLAHAYDRTRQLLARHGVEAPSFPGRRAPSPEPFDAWHLKRYPALYASLDERMRCISELLSGCGPCWWSARIVGAQRTNGHVVLDVLRDGVTTQVRTRTVVVATGRLSPRWIRGWLEPLGARFAFRRLEIGVRIETLATASLFTQLQGVDPKLVVEQDDGTTLLTFCTCRDGEVVHGTAAGINAVSGRADGAATGRSSVGLLARITDEARSRRIEPHVLGAAVVRAPLGEVASNPDGSPWLRRTFGPDGAEIVGRALGRFLASFPDLANDPDAELFAPCIEGVGDYPVSDPDLEIAPNVFIAGDACGRFRGIVASMVSGRYVGHRLQR